MKLTRTLAVAAMTVVATLGLTSPAAAVEPTPQCESNGGARPCWEYYSWYWTYAACHEEGRKQVDNRRYDDYQCDGGATVYLWLRRP
ncbi:hypothetical protein SAMN05421803_104227 [Nocardiopsis flavescens]|uniref:Uncharacterized protein n=1 Tax=Nocardiopsis flavescens TaxID=758803 RepID=A0A1M6HM25_9ACTN|nr:hypothetical protein [Nocardiopsis flavescens]SHJ23217.1 hypothetical protein SAMN05421803_104227 [Nocardiopsis flavescens]